MKNLAPLKINKLHDSRYVLLYVCAIIIDKEVLETSNLGHRILLLSGYRLNSPPQGPGFESQFEHGSFAQ
ncbi:hypothetical protein J6590_031917 [Homalodisca vitripennis]|nr:hypothetical protein J6590_031917 [Homalodisca vitripennis]